MSQPTNDAPRAAPSQPKGSGRRAPWVVLALIIAVGVLSIAAIVVAVLVFRA